MSISSHVLLPLCFLAAAFPASSQSLKLNAPAPLHEGNNQALIDSFVGDHYYFFYAEPGKFHISGPGAAPMKGSISAASPASPRRSIPRPPGRS